LRDFAQGQIDQRSVLATNREELRHDPQHRFPGAGMGLLHQGEDLPRSGPDTLVTADKAVEHVQAAGEAAALLPHGGYAFADDVGLLAKPILLLTHIQQSLPGGAVTVLNESFRLRQFLQFQVEGGQVACRLFGAEAEPFSFALEVVHLGLAGNGFVLQMRSLPHLFQMAQLVRFDTGAKIVELVYRLGQGQGQLLDFLALRFRLSLGLDLFGTGPLGYLLQAIPPAGQLGQSAP
jgi:hypothetical protein